MVGSRLDPACVLSANNALKFCFASSQRNTCDYNKWTQFRHRQRQRQNSSSSRFQVPVALHLMYFAHLQLPFFFHPYRWRMTAFLWNERQDWTISWPLAASQPQYTLHNLRYRTLKDSSSSASAILPRLPHIQKFSLEAEDLISFRSLPMDFAAAIQALCRSPNITTLYLCGITDFPFTMIRTCPNLRCLRLRWCSSNLAVNLIFFFITFCDHLLYYSSLTT